MKAPLGVNPLRVIYAHKLKSNEDSEEMNFHDPEVLRQDRFTRTIITLWTAFLCNFIFWFDDPSISKWMMAVFGLAFVAYLIYQSNNEIWQVLYIFAVYVSFQKVLAGDFGGHIPMFNLTNILLLVLGMGWLSRYVMRGESILRVRPIDGFLIIYIGLIFISLLRTKLDTWYGGSLFNILTDFKRIAEPFFVYFLFTNNLRSRRQVMHLLYVVCLVAGAVGVMGVKQYYMDIGAGSFNDMDKNKITILTDQPNQLATYIGTYAFYLLAVFCFFWRKWWGWASLFLFVFTFQAVRVTFSRGGLVAFYFGLLMFLIAVFRWRVIFPLFACFLVFIAVPEKVVGPRLYKNYKRLVQSTGDETLAEAAKQKGEEPLDRSAASRIEIVEAGIKRLTMDSVSVVFGVGMGLFPQEILKVPGTTVGFIDAHNQWLLILVEAGIIALITIWVIIAIVAWLALKVLFTSRDRMYQAFAAGYFGGLVTMFCSNFVGSRMNSNEVVLLFWIMTAVLFHIVSVEKRKRNSDDGRVKRQLT